MRRLKALSFYQKGILLLMLAMSVIFAFIYPKTISRVGYLYHDAILIPTQENGNTVYAGEIDGEQAAFVVSNNTVAFRYGEKSYGQYTLTEDPTAVPKGEEWSDRMRGVEIRNGDQIVFRGGILEGGEDYWLYNEDGTFHNFGVSYAVSDGVARDENGNLIDLMKPSAATIYELLNDPPLTHKGEALTWFGAVFICMINAISILFADELFWFRLAFRIRDADTAEPSDWEVAGRYIGWTAMTILALIIFVTGLQ